MIRFLITTLFSTLLLVATVSATSTSELKLLTFNILAGGNSANEIGSSSPLYQQPRHADIAAVIIQTGADIVGVLEPNTSGTDPILTALQADNPAWTKRNNLYAKFPIEQDPRNPGDTSTHLVRTGTDQFVICHVAHWRPNNGYGPNIIQERIIAGDIPADPDQFDAEMVADVTIPGTYQATLAKVQPHINAGRPVFILGDFNECSHLDWTSDYAANGMDRWVANPTSTPLRFKITWPGSSLLLGAGLKDSFRSIFPDPVAKPGTTWTPPYANTTPGRRPYDGNSDPNNGAQNQIVVRIDWLLFAGNGVTSTATAVVGENPTNPEHQNKSEIAPDIQYTGSWPSDHRGVLSTFTLPTVTGPEIPATLPSSLPIRESSTFSSGISQIEGDVDPVTLTTFSAAGTPNTTVNGDGTVTIVTPSNAYPAWQLGGSNELDSATGWTWETRMRIDSANVANKGVFEIFLRDNDSGLAATRIHFLEGGLDRDSAGFGVDAEVAADLTDDFHTVRAVVEGGSNLTTVWLDGVKVIDALPSSTFNAGEFGVIGRWGGQTAGGTATIDYIRFDTTGAYAPPQTVGGGETPPPSPADGASIDRCQPLYWWPVTGATGYRVWFGTSSTFTSANYQGEFVENYFDPQHLLENKTYYWRVDVVDGTGIVTGSTFSFSTTTGMDLTPEQSYMGWKLNQFPTATLLDTSKESSHWGDLADLDKDGLATMMECALGGDPAIAEFNLFPKIELISDHPHFIFRQRSGATGTPGVDSRAWGLIYQVQVSDDLDEWLVGSSYVTPVGSPISNGDGTDTVTVRLSISGADRWFARLRVDQSSP